MMLYQKEPQGARSLRELLAAGLSRLGRSVLLWAACASLALVAAGWLGWSWRGPGSAEPALQAALIGEGYMDERFFSLPGLAVALSPVVCLWNLGAEVQDGGIRSKITVGHRRRDVYLSALLLSVLTTTLLCLAVFLPGTAAVLLTSGRLSVSWGAAIGRMAGLALSGAAFASLFTLLGLNIQNRAASAIAGIFLTLALLVTGSLVDRPLAQPEGWTTLTPGAGVGGAAVEVMTPNPSYLPKGPVRDALNALESLLPGGQVAGFSRPDADSPAALALGAAAWIVSTSALGFLIFRRKDLR